MSFGTGHHQTTKLMIITALEIDFENKRVLDMGCGTGILGILASHLGAKGIWQLISNLVCEIQLKTQSAMDVSSF